MKRKEAREQAFIIVFESLFDESVSMTDIIELFDEAVSADTGRDLSFREIDSFAKQSALGVEEHSAKINSVIEELAIGWKISRLSKVSLAVLRLALYEIIYNDEVPVSVSINEAVEITKKYSTKEDSAFVNGLLGTYVRSNDEESK